MAVIGADHADLERRVGKADEAEPRSRNQKMDVGPLVIHVRDTVVGAIVLDAGPGHLAAHPSRLTAGKALAWRLFAEDPAVIFRAHTIVVEPVDTADRPLSD